jgi:hypothetical protein
MTAVGIDQDPVPQSQGGLISGARYAPVSTEERLRTASLTSLKKYSDFNALQASTYIRDAVRYYCPSEAAKTGSPSPSTTEGSCPGGFVPPSVKPRLLLPRHDG